MTGQTVRSPTITKALPDPERKAYRGHGAHPLSRHEITPIRQRQSPARAELTAGEDTDRGTGRAAPGASYAVFFGMRRQVTGNVRVFASCVCVCFMSTEEKRKGRSTGYAFSGQL